MFVECQNSFIRKKLYSTSSVRNKYHRFWNNNNQLIKASLSRISIVLVEPEGADNVGAVSRVMKNFQLSRLVLVNPKCNYLEGRIRAMRGIDVLTSCRVVRSLEEALSGCSRVVASTSRQRDACAELILETPKNIVPWLLHPVVGDSAAIVFGRESSGLTNDELKLAHRFLKIPASEEYPVLNLALAVGIVCYELYLWNNGSMNLTHLQNTHEEASFETKESLYKRLEKFLLSISFISEQNKKKRMLKFRSMLNRLNMSPKEANMLHGIISHVEQTWKISD